MVQYVVIDDDIKKYFKPLMSDYIWELFQMQEDFMALGAVCDGAACGYLVFEMNDEGYDIQDIMVHPDYRRKGIGTGLLYMLIDIAQEDIEDIDCHFVVSENDDFLKFIMSTGLFDMAEENGRTKVFRGDIAALFESKRLQPYMGLDPAKEHCMDFYSELLSAGRNYFIKECMENSYLPNYFISAMRPKETKYCYVISSENHRDVNAYIKVNAYDDTLDVESVWARKGYEKNLLTLFGCVAAKVKADDTDNKYKYIETCTINENVEAIVKRVMPDIKEEAKGYSVYWNYKSHP